MMGFYFKVAPGVRIRATSRGLRASVGPRAARVHFGSGGTGFSTGAGPVSLYEAVGGGRGRRSGGASSRTSIAAYERQLRQAQKAQQANDLTAAFDAIENLHRQDFAPATAPVVPAPPPVDDAAIRRWHEQQALRGLNVLQRSARASARKQAAYAAERDIRAAVTDGVQEQQRLQSHLNEQWHRLLANDPSTVFATLTEAFEDNDAPAAVAGVDDGEASVVVMAPGIEVVPERMPKLTPAGNLSLAKLTKSLRNSYYVRLVCGHVLVTVREALAVAPGLRAVRVAVIRRPPANAYGDPTAECLLAALFTRQRLQGVQWQSADAIRIVQDVSAELRIRLSAAHALLPLDLAKEPSLAALLQDIGLNETGWASEAEEPAAGDSASTAGSQLPDASAGSGHRASTVTRPALEGPAPTAPLSPPHQGPPVREISRGRKKPFKAALIAVGAVVLLLIIVGIAAGGGNSTKTAAITKPTHTVASSPAPTPHPAKAPPKKKLITSRAPGPAPRETAAAVAPRETAAAAAPSPAAPSTPVAAPAQPAPVSCHPLTNAGNCYEPGEFCRKADHGASGVAGDGKTITCEYNDGWRWEPA